ncbi:MAG: efflux RND transporter periplasmic adaptor subunit, partial [Deltaproteobacteria bacterium]|nr:efflux RND transporter periplasmic adaptor subunit [Deltaproteobacteria bacterium]
MKRFLIGFLILILGLAVGGVGTWLYVKEQGARGKGQGAIETKQERKILFYRAPMNPQQTSPTPMKDEMGMDYVPVYDEEAATEKEVIGTVKITPEKIQKIGVKTEEAKIRTLKRTIRTVGRIEPVENKVYNINTKVAGWVE